MNKLLLTAAFAGVLAMAGCTSTQISQATEAGLLVAGKDPEKAKSIGEAAGKVTGSAGEMPIEKEVGIGESIALSSFAQRGRLHPSDELQTYVNKVGKIVALAGDRPNIDYFFAVVDSADVNAWAAPGGYVFVTSGAIAQMSDEAELAGVLGHEITHVTEKHMVKMLNRGQFLEGVQQGVQATTKDDLAKYTAAVDQSTDILFNKGLDRGMELEADKFGTTFAARAGYDPTGLERYLTKINAGGTKTGGGWFASTHPTIESRIQSARQGEAAVAAGGVVNKERFQQVISRTLR